MNAAHPHPIEHLVDEAKFYWAVLQTAVRLERSWHSALDTQLGSAHGQALLLGRTIAAGERPVDTLADLRELVMQRIRSVLQTTREALPAAGLHERAHVHLQRTISDVAEIAALLDRGVDVRNCACTCETSARRQLVNQLSPGEEAQHLVDAAAELTKLACAQAQRRLNDCLSDGWAVQYLTTQRMH